MPTNAEDLLTPAQKSFLSGLSAGAFHHMYDEEKSGPADLIEVPDTFVRIIDTTWADRIMIGQINGDIDPASVRFKTKKETTNLLNPQEETELFVYYNSVRYLIAQEQVFGDQSSLIRLWELSLKIEDRITHYNLGLMLQVSKKYASFCKGTSDNADILSDASVTMVHAIRLFNPYLGFKFSTYYYRAAMQKCGRGNQRNSEQKSLVRSMSSFTSDESWSSAYNNLTFKKPEEICDKETAELLRNIASGLWHMPRDFELDDYERSVLWFRFFGQTTTRNLASLCDCAEYLKYRHGHGRSKERIRQLLSSSLQKVKAFLDSKQEPIKAPPIPQSETETSIPEPLTGIDLQHSNERQSSYASQAAGETSS